MIACEENAIGPFLERVFYFCVEHRADRAATAPSPLTLPRCDWHSRRQTLSAPSALPIQRSAVTDTAPRSWHLTPSPSSPFPAASPRWLRTSPARATPRRRPQPPPCPPPLPSSAGSARRRRPSPRSTRPLRQTPPTATTAPRRRLGATPATQAQAARTSRTSGRRTAPLRCTLGPPRLRLRVRAGMGTAFPFPD